MSKACPHFHRAHSLKMKCWPHTQIALQKKAMLNKRRYTGVKKRIRLFVEKEKEKEIVTSNSNMPTPNLQISNKCILPATFQSQVMATHPSSDSGKHIF